MHIITSKNIDAIKLPKIIHLSDVSGYVKLSASVREELKKLLK